MSPDDVIKVALIGDYQPSVTAHVAIPQALELGAQAGGIAVHAAWVATPELEEQPQRVLAAYDGVWCVPASPYLSMRGALNAIHCARRQPLPFLGTCGGYQHAALEYAINVLGLAQAGNAEVDPQTSMALISPLACALVEADGEITFEPGSRMAALHTGDRSVETYHCSYGINPDLVSVFAGSDLRITGWDSNGEPRALELAGHPFFMATAYQPERSALRGEPHGLVTAFLLAAAASRAARRKLARA